MSSETPKKTVSIVAFMKRKPGLTHEQFYQHWVHVHGPLVKPWAQKHGFLEYRQIHLYPALNANRTVVGPERAGRNTELENWDGCAVFEIESLERFEAAFEDPYYKDVIAKDEEQFIDKAAGVMRRRGELNRII
ncbi:hypothetical protein SPBR_01046 [Sporothrix brasiliensis 5110]|uniref:EthD domain-containing protein n=1 Tax=Sporothrix brasiliensis 5110 TaxID=1398154 RepID=A0A0C2EVF0_9PEZI|nr:uncharacterized protein SPBR_01046 [Sporothrix brasiliensis 5110]KIH90559.1 hypothetical protein SPBR_01046 [Sporothrix brasiliensis 5110]